MLFPEIKIELLVGPAGGRHLVGFVDPNSQDNSQVTVQYSCQLD